jgi:predicted dehydrogenase
MLENEQIDVVHICAPNYLHYEIAELALQKGKHVVCEKPLVTTMEEAEKLVRLAGEKGLVAAVSFNLRYYPLVQQAKAMIQQGELGTLYSYHGSYLQDWLLLETDYSWRLDPAISGRSRAFADIGSHWLDMAEYVSGKRVTSLCADLATFLPTRKKPVGDVQTFQKASGIAEYESVQISTEDYASILFRFEDGVRGSLTVSQVSAGRKNRLTFEADGAKSAIAWNSENPNEMWVGRRDQMNGILIKDPSLMLAQAARHAAFPGGHTEGFPDTTKQLFLEVYSYILREGEKNDEMPAFPTFEDGARGVLLCNAVLESSRKSAWLSV